MTWLNPWAWAGLSMLGLPVLIHLLGRGHARVLPFPSLRFLAPSRLLPSRRTRVHDALLLLVRLGILAAAVAALAQPLFLTRGRASAVSRTLVRAIVVDTSPSMHRRTLSGEVAIDAARREARRLAGEAQTSIVVESSVPAGELAALAAWLAKQSGRAEVVVVSDLQRGTLDSTDVAAVPQTVGVRLARIAVVPSILPIETRAAATSGEVVARITPSAQRTDVEWSMRGSSGGPPVTILAGDEETTRANAALLAAGSSGVRLPFDTAHLVAIVFPAYRQRGELVRGAVMPRSPWTTSLVARLKADSSLTGAAANSVQSVSDTRLTPLPLRLPVPRTRAEPPHTVPERGLVVARTSAGRPIVIAMQDSAQGRDRLLLFCQADAGTLTSAALIAAAMRAVSVAAPVAELEPDIIPDSRLTAWERPAAARTAAQHPAESSDGRWFWIIALGLLVLESWLRRARRQPAEAPMAHDRAA